MIDVANLRPSDIERLAEEGLSPGIKDEILSGVSKMVNEVRPDGGADSDRIHLAANLLAMAGAWKSIKAGELARALEGGQQQNIVVFLQGLPPNYNREVAYELITGNKETKVVNRAYRVTAGRLIETNRARDEEAEVRRESVLRLLKKWRARRPNTQAKGLFGLFGSLPTDIQEIDPEEVIVFAADKVYIPVGRNSETGRFNKAASAKTKRAVSRPRRFT